jgi:hypothetical protein
MSNFCPLSKGGEKLAENFLMLGCKKSYEILEVGIVKSLCRVFALAFEELFVAECIVNVL